MENKQAADPGPGPGPDSQMGAMSPQPTTDQQQGAPGQYPPGQYPPQAHFPQGQPQQPPPGYAPQPNMDPATAAMYPGQPQQPPPGYAPQPNMDPATAAMYPGQSQTYGTPLVSLNQQPAPVACPHCGHRGMTQVGYESGGFTHLMALLFCRVICLPCIPYVIAGLKDVHHKCSSCGTALATYHRSGRTEVHYQPAP